jgi:hypothetical protein
VFCFCHPNLFQVAQQSGACLGHAGIGLLAARHHRPAAFSAVRKTAASALRWNWSAQIGAIAALLAVLSANVFAVLPSIHPPQLNPMPSVAAPA